VAPPQARERRHALAGRRHPARPTPSSATHHSIRPPRATPTQWRATAESWLVLVNELVERHLRISELLDLLDEARGASRQSAWLRQQLDAMRNSRSWRVTRPLRRGRG